jgi:hypothetical protein
MYGHFTGVVSRLRSELLNNGGYGRGIRRGIVYSLRPLMNNLDYDIFKN